jgi:hypothetical protein
LLTLFRIFFFFAAAYAVLNPFSDGKRKSVGDSSKFIRLVLNDWNTVADSLQWDEGKAWITKDSAVALADEAKVQKGMVHALDHVNVLLAPVAVAARARLASVDGASARKVWAVAMETVANVTRGKRVFF